MVWLKQEHSTGHLLLYFCQLSKMVIIIIALCVLQLTCLRRLESCLTNCLTLTKSWWRVGSQLNQVVVRRMRMMMMIMAAKVVWMRPHVFSRQPSSWGKDMVLMMLIYLIDAQFSTLSWCFHRSESPIGLEVYLHALQLLTTVDEGIQTLGKSNRCSLCWVHHFRS